MGICQTDLGDNDGGSVVDDDEYDAASETKNLTQWEHEKKSPEKTLSTRFFSYFSYFHFSFFSIFFYLFFLQKNTHLIHTQLFGSRMSFHQYFIFVFFL